MTTDQELRITWEWEPAPDVRVREHRATWARMQVYVGTDCVTLVEDRESGSSRRSIYCPLYPLAEWVAYNWWFLQADARPSGFLSQDRGHVNPASRKLPAAMRDRHSIRASGDGFAWPDLLIVPDGGQTRLVWEPDRVRPSNWPVRFLTRGDARVRSVFVQRELELLVSSVLTRLTEQGVTDTVLAKEWASIQQTSAEEVEYCLAAARLGLDPYCEAERYEHEIIRASESLNDGVLNDFLNAVEPSRIETALTWVLSASRAVARTTRTVRSLAADADKIEVMRASAPAADSLAHLPPWDVGFMQARAIREAVTPESTEAFPVERYLSKITRPDADRSVQAVGSGTADRDYPLVVLGTRRPPTSSRFTLSRALWHFIWDESPTFMITSAHTYPQRVERAFAAEILAPAKGIASLLESPPDAATQDELEQLARHFGVSSMVIDHQVRNHLLAAP